MSSTPENTASISTTAMAEPAIGRSGSSIPAMPAYHGTRAPPNGSVRRRWRSRDKKAANEGAIELSKACDDSFSESDWGSSPPSPSHAAGLPTEKRAEPVHVPGHAQVQVSGHGFEGDGSQRKDGWVGGSPPNSPPAPSRPTKPVLAAFSTSAEIVDALMPERPTARSFPVRTAGVYLPRERQTPLPRSRLISRPA